MYAGATTTTLPPEGGGRGDDIASDIGSELKVVLDRWSPKQLDWPDLWLSLAVLAVAIGLAYLVRWLIRRSTRSLAGSAAAAVAVIGQIVSIGIYLFATAIVLEVFGFTLGPVLILGLLAVVLLIVLRPLLQNLSSGLLVQLRGQVRPGDVIEFDGEVGTVEEINSGAVVLRTVDGRTVLLPNDRVVAETLVNYSLQGRRRSGIPILLPDDVDLDAVSDRIVAAVEELPAVLEDPPPALVVTGFGGTEIWAEVQFWYSPDVQAELVAKDQVGREFGRLFRTDVRTSGALSVLQLAER